MFAPTDTQALVVLIAMAALVLFERAWRKARVKRTLASIGHVVESKKTKEITELAEREGDINYRRARGHNVTREEVARLKDDFRAWKDRHGVTD
jgi:hypothetical protein